MSENEKEKTQCGLAIKTILRGTLKALSFYIRKIRSQISNIIM